TTLGADANHGWLVSTRRLAPSDKPPAYLPAFTTPVVKPPEISPPAAHECDRMQYGPNSRPLAADVPVSLIDSVNGCSVRMTSAGPASSAEGNFLGSWSRADPARTLSIRERDGPKADKDGNKPFGNLGHWETPDSVSE